MSLFKNKYRNESARRVSWDYSVEGKYFITICTKPRRNCFGNILHERVVLSFPGMIVDECRRLIPEHYDNVVLGEYVFMPDHFHGILTIATGHAPSQRPSHRSAVGNMVGSFKSAATKKIRKMGYREFGWQERFYDRVIRNENELRRIGQYIRNNPEKWKNRGKG